MSDAVILYLKAIAAILIAPHTANAPTQALAVLPAVFFPGVGVAAPPEVAVPVCFPQVVHTDGFRVLSPPVTDTLLSAGPGPKSVTPAALLVPTLVGDLVAVASRVLVASSWI